MSPPPELTLTALLNSLHTHLQSQTKLLPTLHLQLGLPPTALEDELKTIQQHLIQSLESQINVRRQEVQAWLEKCDAVERQCIRYTKALGGNVKPQTGPSVGELRKEQVLPRRYELVSAHQEKLRQVCYVLSTILDLSPIPCLEMYHTKLEQLTTLTARLKALARTLGSDFYAPDILEPTVSGGQPDNDKSSHRDVTPERFSKLEKELVRGKGEVVRIHTASCWLSP
jgi:Ase1/PRC1/MAP65 family protein